MQCKISEQALNEVEQKHLNKFLVEHQVYCPEIRNSCNYSLVFSTTGIGVGVDVKCGFCGEKHDITDYGSW